MAKESKKDKSKPVKEIRLKVAEAVQDDVNKGIVRIDSGFMHEIGVRPGEIVEIEGERKTVSITDRAYPADMGLNIIRMDGIVRHNSRTGIGELVKVRKVDIKEAKQVVIAPARRGLLIRASPHIFKQGLLGRALMKGDIVALGGVSRRRTTLSQSPFEDIFRMIDEEMAGFPGFGDIKFIVAEAIPKQAVIITDLTDVVFNPEAIELKEERILEVTYDDVGGLSDEISKIREMVELPLKHPEIFERLGIEAPKGVLLHGPPGCGKTLLAKAVANESNAHFLLINGPEVMSKFYGQSEQNLRKKFEEAEKHAPSIVFIDEVDAIASKREEIHGEVERRVVAQLLALMDGLKSRGKVVVIAASNVPNLLDPALRRPGRFDREIEIGVPDKKARLEILKIHTRNMPLEKNVNIKALADVTYGFVGADLAALAKEAAMIVLRRVLPELKLKEEEPIPKDTLEKLRINMKDFKDALKAVRPSAMREVMVEKPNVKWEDIGGLENVKQELIEAVEWPLKYPTAFKRLGVKPPKGILLYGAPGTGKTLLAKAVANESQANFILVKGPELLCLDGNTNVFTDFCGVKKIEDFYDNIKEVSKVIKKTKNMEIRRLTSPVHSYAMNKDSKLVKTRINKVYKLFVADTYKLNFEDNNEIIVSKNQPFYTFRNGKLQWVRTEDIKPGEFVAKPSKLPFFNKSIKLELPKYKHLTLVKEDDKNYYTKIFSSKEITKLPKKIDESLASFLGWFVAEGNISKEQVVICNENKEYRNEIRKLFELFADKDRIKEDKKGVFIYSTPLVKYLEMIFETKLGIKKSHTIPLPPIITKSSKKIICSFLNSLYKGDGHIGSTKIEYGTMSKKLAQSLNYLLTLLGIKFKFWKRSDGLYINTISGKLDMNKFRNEVLNENNSLEVRDEYNAQYLIPKVSKYLKYCKKELNLTYDKEIPDGSFEHIISGRRRCGLLRFRRIMDIFNKYCTKSLRNDEIFTSLQQIAEGDLCWTKIKAKRKAKPRYMYDFETEDGSFIGGNTPLILHNSKWVGESEKAVREVFKKARQTAPTIIFFDEMDSLAPKRGLSADSRVSERVVNQILTEMDGLEEMHDVIILAASNRPDMIDPALLRPGRFDRLILTPVPDEKARLEIFKVHTKEMPLKGVNIEALAKKTLGYAGSDIEAVCREAAMLALRKDINTKQVTQKHFDQALEKVKSSVTKDIEQAYSQVVEQFQKSHAKAMKEEKPSYLG